MNADAAPAANSSAGLRGLQSVYRETTGQSLRVWALIAFLNFATQIVLFHEMVIVPRSSGALGGEFGTLNSALGIIGLLAIPVLALHQAFALFFARAQNTRLDRLRESSLTIIETGAWAWGSCCFVLLLLPLPLPYLPRFPLQLFTLMNTLLALGAVVSSALCSNQHGRWIRLLVCAAVARLVLGGGLAAYEPWAEAGLAGFLLAGLVTLIPALNPRDIDAQARMKACATLLDRDFLVFAAATFSTLLGIYLFTNADRIAALGWVDINAKENFYPSVGTRHEFDDYQATGLLARMLIWGTQPLLWMFYAERSRLAKTTSASLKFFWIYLSMLLAGALALGYLTHVWGSADMVPAIGKFGPTFAAVMVPLGLLQAFAVFTLASRRFPECFVLGACSVGYALVLAWFGRRPDIMLPYMFGLALVSIMIVLFVGVVRWGRKQP
jgi:hypothetical protein